MKYVNVVRNHTREFKFIYLLLTGYILGTVASVLRERDGEGAFLASKNKHYGIGSNPKMFR